jgi:hypothetical protein
MNGIWCVTARVVLLGSVLVSVPVGAAAQVISLKTIPVAAGDQFLLFPSDKLGMGGVAIALDDSLLDPFINPAKGARLSESRVFAAPTFYSMSQNAGSARSLPVGVLFRSGRTFGGGMAALQQLKAGDQVFWPGPFFERAVLPPDALSRRSATNKYVFLTLGTVLPGEVALGASAFLADLNAIDGVEHLYAMASSIEQSGSVEDFRFGLTKSFGNDRTLEAVLVHNRFDMDHDVAYVEWIVVDSTNWIWEPRERVENNLDKTRTWGAHLGYAQPVGRSGWRVGGVLTANRKSHPKIPNYELVNIPRDPGNSTAFDIGVGIAKTDGNLTFGMDIVYEPATSDTWAEAADTVTTASGGSILPGGKTIENAFRHSNAFVSLGVSQAIGPAAFQLGLHVRAYDYHLDQWDNVTETLRRQDEQWMEWVPSWGARVRIGEAEIRYMGRVTTGTGRPGVAWTPTAESRFTDAGLANDIVVAPGGPLTLQDVTVTTHQVSVSLPIR